LSKATWVEKRKIIDIIKNHNEESQEVKKVIDFVIGKGGLAYANTVMLEYKDRALQSLHKMAESDSPRSLERLLTYSIERQKQYHAFVYQDIACIIDPVRRLQHRRRKKRA